MRVSSVGFDAFSPAAVGPELWSSTLDHRFYALPSLHPSPSPSPLFSRPFSLSAILPLLLIPSLQQMGRLRLPIRACGLHRRHESPKISGAPPMPLPPLPLHPSSLSLEVHRLNRCLLLAVHSWRRCYLFAGRRAFPAFLCSCERFLQLLQ
jgi:hypothetical protein